MMIMSLVETARANNSIPYYYLKYLMEEMAKGVHYRHEYRIEDMTPWSEAYRAYEKQQRKMLPAGGAPPGNIKPHTPKKKEVIEIA